MLVEVMKDQQQKYGSSSYRYVRPGTVQGKTRLLRRYQAASHNIRDGKLSLSLVWHKIPTDQYGHQKAEIMQCEVKTPKSVLSFYKN